MAEVGTYYITVMPDMSRFTGGVNSALKGLGTQGGKEYSRSFSDVLRGSALGTALGGLAQSAGRSIMSGLRTGIGRLDTIRNFPKVMQALGFSADDAADSIQLIMDHLDGLPTATQDVVALTQSIADSTGDLTLATEAALGFNDMMLASGASTGEVTQAQGVLNRVLGKGSATVAQWQSLQSVMPAQLAAVARELGGESMSVEELREKLNDGTISWDEFLRAIVKLDKDGSGAMASFSEQAKANSVGIGTALENVQNRIGAGWASILDAFGQENISGAIDKASYGVRDAMGRIAEGISYVADLVAKTPIGENLRKVGETIGNALSSIWKDGGPEMLKAVADALVALVDGGLQWLADNGDAVTAAVSGIAGAIAGIIGWNLGLKLAALPGILSKVWMALAANPFGVVVTAVAAVVMALYGFFKYTKTGQAIWKKFTTGIAKLWEGLRRDFKKGVDQIRQNLEASAKQWEVFKGNVARAVEAVKNAVRAAWSNVKTTVTTVTTTVKTTVSNAFTAVKTTVSAVMTTVKTTVSNAWTAIKTAVSTAITTVKTTVSNGFTAVRTTATTAWGNIKTAVSNGINGAKTAVSTAVEAIKRTASNAWNSVKSTATTVWGGVKTAISTPINSAKEAVSKAVESIKSTVSQKLAAAKETASNAFNSVKDKLTKPFTDAKNAISGAIDNIKRMFPFNLGNILSLKLPHISVYAGEAPWGIGGKGRLPSFSVKWWARGGVFDSPSIIGVGEAGPEAVVPLKASVYREMARGILAEGGGRAEAPTILITGNEFHVREEADIDRVADRLARRIRREGVALA